MTSDSEEVEVEGEDGNTETDTRHTTQNPTDACVAQKEADPHSVLRLTSFPPSTLHSLVYRSSSFESTLLP